MSHLAPTRNYLSMFSPDGVNLWHEHGGKNFEETISLRFEQSLSEIACVLEAVREKIGTEWHDRGFSDEDIQQFENFERLVADQIHPNEGERKRMPFLREKLNAILKIVLDKRLAKGLKRDLSRAASLFLRTSCLQDLVNAERIVGELLEETSSFCEFYSLVDADEEPLELVPVVNVINNAIRAQSGYASKERIELHPKWLVTRGEKFRVQIDGMTRALSNIIHNAIKYSYKMTENHAWVNITCDRDGSKIMLCVENWGLAIPEDEIQSGDLFLVGHRGSLSRRRGAKGTGLGLAYAQAIVQKHGGEINIVSKPARSQSSPTDYSCPFITKVTVSVPVGSEELD